MDCTCAELTGSGSVATEASRASFMMPIISGGNDAFEKSFISVLAYVRGGIGAFVGNFSTIRGNRLIGTFLPLDLWPDSVMLLVRNSRLGTQARNEARAVAPCVARPDVSKTRLPSGARSPGERREPAIRIHCCANMTYRSWAKAVASNFGHRADLPWPRQPSLSPRPGERSRAGRQRSLPGSQRLPGPKEI
jgi:hypothetical protein